METEIIKVSFSELDAFTTCPQKWAYRYDQRLVSKLKATPLELGSCCHAGLEAHYKGGDWKQGINDYVDRGIAATISEGTSEDELDDMDLDLELFSYDDIRNSAHRILEEYFIKYAEEEKDWEILEVEKFIEIPLTSGIQSPTFGKDKPVYYEVRLTGVIDLILKDKDGNVWIMDHKFIGRNFRQYESLVLDAQIGVYQWAAQQLGYNAIGFIYNENLTKVPDTPKINKTKNKLGGYVSIAECYTTWEKYAEFVEAQGENPELYREEMYKKFYNKKFHNRHYVYRSQTEIENFAENLKARVKGFVRNREDIYMTPSKYSCLYCDYADVCRARLRGEDTEDLLTMQFDVKKRRSEANA